MKIADWMSRSGVAFGTSGARGLVTSMTDALCFVYVVGYLEHMRALGEFSNGMDVAIAGDLRPSTPRIMRACAAAIIHQGGKPLYCGHVPTPALCLYAFGRGIPSLMVTGSHIPADRNGIKFNRAHGEFLKSDETPMREQTVELPAGWFTDAGVLIRDVQLPPVTDVTTGYIERYRDFFGATALEGMRLGVYQHSAVGRDVVVEVVRALGAQAIPLARSETFISVDTEAVRPEDVTLAKEWAATGEYDAILTTDGDSDRPLLADGSGNWLRGDVLGILAANYLGAVAVATPVSSNTALEKMGFAHLVQRTRIGSPFVVDAMTKAGDEGLVPSVGYEANGGFLLASQVIKNNKVLDALPTRDSVLPMLCALVAAKVKGSGISGLLANLPSRFTLSDRLAELPTEKSREKILALTEQLGTLSHNVGLAPECGNVREKDETDGLRLTFANGEIIHFRPSGNAPELRVYVEADSPERAAALLATGLKYVSNWQ